MDGDAARHISREGLAALEARPRRKLIAAAHQRLVERSIPGIENASPEQLIRADGVGACPLREASGVA
jgi:hypothetical protein